MDFFDFDFDFQDWLIAVLVGIFLLGSVQLHAVMSERALQPVDEVTQPNGSPQVG